MKLNEIASISAGYPFRGKIPEKTDSSLIVVQMKDVSVTNGIDWANCTGTELTGKREPNYLSVGDILIAARGSYHYATKICQELSATGKQAVAAPHFFIVRLNNQAVMPEFLVWLLNQSPAQRHFEQSAEGTLTKSIRRNVLENTPLAVPPIAKQKLIVDIASALKEEQKLMDTIINNGERMMSAIAKNLYLDANE